MDRLKKMLESFKEEMNEITDSYSDYIKKNYVEKKDHNNIVEILERTVYELKKEKEKNRRLEVERNYLKKNNKYMKVLLSESYEVLKKAEEQEYKRMKKIDDLNFLNSMLISDSSNNLDNSDKYKTFKKPKNNWKQLDKIDEIKKEEKPKNNLRKLMEKILEEKLDISSSQKEMEEIHYNVNLYS